MDEVRQLLDPSGLLNALRILLLRITNMPGRRENLVSDLLTSILDGGGTVRPGVSTGSSSENLEVATHRQGQYSRHPFHVDV